MNSELLDSLYRLKEALANNADIILLNELEKKMLSDEKFIELSKEKEKLTNLIHKDDIDMETIKKIDEITIQMRALPVTKDYLVQYNKVTHIYDKINKELFYPFTNKTSLRELLRHDQD